LLNLKLRNKWRILLATDFIKITSSKESWLLKWHTAHPMTLIDRILVKDSGSSLTELSPYLHVFCSPTPSPTPSLS
jgi:hypothetical protein